MPIADYQPEDNNGSQSILGADIHTDIAQKPGIEGFQDSPEGREMMEAHYFDMMNLERLQTSVPLDEAYKREAIKQAEAFLIADGFKLITDGELEPSLFR